MKVKHRIFLAVALSAIAGYFVVRQITPDVCWPNSAMFAFIAMVTGVFMVSVTLLSEGLLRVKKLSSILRLPLQLLGVFTIAGIAVAISDSMLASLGQTLGSDEAICFSSLASNYLNRYVDIFWIFIFSGVLFVASSFLPGKE